MCPPGADGNGRRPRPEPRGRAALAVPGCKRGARLGVEWARKLSQSVRRFANWKIRKSVSDRASQKHFQDCRRVARGIHSTAVFRLLPILKILELARRSRTAKPPPVGKSASQPQREAPYPAANCLARSVARITALMRATRRPPSSSSRMPSMVQPAGVVTASFKRAGW